MDFLIYFILTLFVTTMILLIGGTAGTFFVKVGYKIAHERLKRKLSVYGYRCFYLDHKSMYKDTNCMRIIPVLRELYVKGSSFNVYCARLSEERLPMIVMINWARSVAEDLFVAPIPAVKLDHWNHYWKSSLYVNVSLLHSDFPRYDDYEMGCLWGTIYLWLAVCFEKDVDDPLLQRIVQLACKEATAVPYFQFLYHAARKMNGRNFFLKSMPNVSDFGTDEDMDSKQVKNSISAEEIYAGFEALSVSERCNTRRVLNDLLADCPAWSYMRNEMRGRGWFKESIYPVGETRFVIKGDYVLEKNVGSEVTNVEAGGIGFSIDQKEQ